MEAIRSSETSVQTRSTWPQIPEDGILHGHSRENHKSYNYPLDVSVRQHGNECVCYWYTANFMKVMINNTRVISFATKTTF
jgi:hypothetical protein